MTNRGSKGFQKLKAGIFLLVGLVLGIGAVVTTYGRVQFLRTAARATGTVSALNAGGAHPQVDFEVDGLRVSYPQGGGIFGYSIGEHVTVLYDVENPRMTATIDSPGALWFGTCFLYVFSVAFFCTGVLLLRRAR